MGLSDDLTKAVKDVLKGAWTSRDGTVVPKPTDIKLGNDAVKLDAAILYADLKG